LSSTHPPSVPPFFHPSPHLTLPHSLSPTHAPTHQEILLSEILFVVSSKVYLDGISDRYAGHAPWSLPLPIPPSAESFINAVLFTGVVVPLVLRCGRVNTYLLQVSEN